MGAVAALREEWDDQVAKMRDSIFNDQMSDLDVIGWSGAGELA